MTMPLCSPAEFEGLVQRNLGANAGLDWAGLGSLLRCIADHSLAMLEAGQDSTPASTDQAAEEPAAIEQPAVAAAAAAAAGLAAQSKPALGGRGYHAFRLQRAAYVLQELLAEQRRIDGAGCCCCDTDAMQTKQEVQQAAYHAAQIAANSVCLKRIAQQLHAMGLELL